jgi:hypothetical protein
VKKRILAIATLALLCFGSVVIAQNTNSSTTSDANKNMSSGNMSNGNMSGGRKHRKHRKHAADVVQARRRPPRQLIMGRTLILQIGSEEATNSYEGVAFTLFTM